MFEDVAESTNRQQCAVHSARNLLGHRAAARCCCLLLCKYG